MLDSFESFATYLVEISIFTYLVGVLEVLLSLRPLLGIEANISEAEEALQLHAAGLDLRRDEQAALELPLGVVELALKQVADRQLPVRQAHAFKVFLRFADLERLLELQPRTLVLAHESRADCRVVDCNELVRLIRVLGVLAMVQVTQVILLAFEEDDSETVEGEGAADIVVENPGAEVESFVILAGRIEVALLLRQLAHLEVYVSLFQEVSLLDASLRFDDEVLRGLSDVVDRPRPSIKRYRGRVVLVPSAARHKRPALRHEKPILRQRDS